MWKKFLECLGKFGQKIKDIFKKPKKQYDPMAPESNGLKSKAITFFLDNEEVIDFKPLLENGKISIEFTNDLEKIFSMSKPILPKRYRVKTLILTMAANQPYEYQCVDMSQYEEKGIAHYIVGSTRSPEEIEAEQRIFFPEVEYEEEGLWVEDMASSVLPNVDLLYYEEYDIWELDWDSL